MGNDIVEQEKSFLGRGIHFPIQADPLYGKVMESSHEDNISEAIWLILMTKKGERVMRPDFGCGIWSYSFDDMNYTSISRIEEEVHNSLVRWEPRITNIDVKAEIRGYGVLDIHIEYLVRSTNNPYNLVFPFQFTEGYGIGAEK